jgi:hypothetical protein
LKSIHYQIRTQCTKNRRAPTSDFSHLDEISSGLVTALWGMMNTWVSKSTSPVSSTKHSEYSNDHTYRQTDYTKTVSTMIKKEATHASFIRGSWGVSKTSKYEILITLQKTTGWVWPWMPNRLCCLCTILNTKKKQMHGRYSSVVTQPSNSHQL